MMADVRKDYDNWVAEQQAARVARVQELKQERDAALYRRKKEWVTRTLGVELPDVPQAALPRAARATAEEQRAMRELGAMQYPTIEQAGMTIDDLPVVARVRLARYYVQQLPGSYKVTLVRAIKRARQQDEVRF